MFVPSRNGIDADFEGEGVAVAGGAAGGEAALLGGAFAVDAAEGVPGARLQGELGVDGVAAPVLRGRGHSWRL